MTTLAIEPTIQLASGRVFNFLKPEETEFLLTDIAHALANVARFAGHTRSFYSVAQHSVHVAELVAPKHQLAALLHDATEAFLGDITTPLKQLLPEYQKIEERVHNTIMDQCELPRKLHASIKRADTIMLVTEQRDLMPLLANGHPFIERDVQPRNATVVPVSPFFAKRMFIRKYYEIQDMA